MSFVVSARKYRPQNFDELVGQDHIATTLKNAIKNDKLAHAFLFSGPRGVGKTTSARILAKVLNCQNLTEAYHPCNTCDACEAFTSNASFNIFELDAASNNSVEHIRALNDQVRFQPQQGAFKIYIIDEVHMLSQAAFNAFLKTLEEPPPYAKFILATTEKHKIIPTILSRCQIFDFRRIQIKDIVHQLRHISDQESRNIDEDAFHLMAQKADGAMRDALSIYDKVVSTVDGDISYKDVATNLNVLDHDYYFRIVDQAVKEDLPSLFLELDAISRYGFEMEQFIQGLLSHLRQLLLIKDVRTAELLEVGEKLKERYENQAALASKSFILSALSLLEKTELNLVRAQNKRLSTEIALSKMAYMNRLIEKKNLAPDPSQQPAKTAAPLKTKAAEAPHKEIKPISKAEATGIDLKKSKKPLTAKTSPSKGKRFSSGLTPSISADIDSLVALVSQEQSEKMNIDNPLTVEFVEGIINEMKQKSKLNSFKSSVDVSKVTLEGEKIVILSPNEVMSNLLKQEKNFVERIRAQYPNRDLEIDFKDDRSAFPDFRTPEKTKTLTTADKLDLLRSQNPEFVKFAEVFKLKPLN